MKELTESSILKATQKGADECDIFISINEEFSTTVKNNEIESLKQAVSYGFGIRVFKDRKIGFAYTTDLSARAIEKTIDKAISLAHNSTPESENQLPNVNQPPQNQIKIFDPSIFLINTEQKVKIAKEVEKIAKSLSSKIEVESAGFENLIHRRIVANSNGFFGEYEGTIFEIYCSTIASDKDESQTGFYSSISRFFDKLLPLEDIAKNAVNRSLQLLNPKKIKTGRYSVIFDNTTAKVIASYIATAVNGKNALQKMTFLSDKINEKVGSEVLNIIDDGCLDFGIGSKPFDDEGVQTKKKLIIENGVLKTFLLDTITANKLSLLSTGNAYREYNTVPTPSPLNFYIQPGLKSLDEIIKEITEGLLVTKTIGFGVDIVSGNFSKGASGIWIKNGELTFPVDKITIAGNLNDILKSIISVGNDLIFFDNIASPSILVSEMTITCD